jgi:peptidoglycan hydrolase-like protein with peptidoglycan-binding domain
VARVFTKPMLAAELARARTNGWDRACASAEKECKLPPGLLLAIASQETDMNDVVGDGGHGRGLFQIDDRSHTTFLRQQGASKPGGKPAVPAAAKYAAGLVRFNFDFGVKNGVPERDRLRFALSAYNAGAGGALEGFKAGDSDRRTTGGDYGKAVLGRFGIYQSLLGVAPPPVLQEGSRNKSVSEFKEALEAWYERHLPGLWETFRITPGPRFGARLAAAVSDFQNRVRIEIDGVVGEDTRNALAKDKKPRKPR